MRTFRRHPVTRCAAIAACTLCCALAVPRQALARDVPPIPAAAVQQPLAETPATERRPLGAPGPSQSTSDRSAGDSRGGGITQTLLALGGVLALAIIGSAIVRAIARTQGGLRASLGAGGRAPSGILEVLGRYPIARGSSLVLLKLDRRILLLSQSAQGRLGTGAAFSTLCEITDPEEIASILVKARDAEGDSMAHRFRGMLSRFDRTIEEQEGASAQRRRTVSGPDRAELWDETHASIPLVDLTRQPGPAEQSPIASLRKRLASLRTSGGDA